MNSCQWYAPGLTNRLPPPAGVDLDFWKGGGVQNLSVLLLNYRRVHLFKFLTMLATAQLHS